MSKLYIFTVRDVKIDGKIQYNGLIPKLFSTLFDNPDLKFETQFDKNILKEQSKMEIFFDLLKSPKNLLWKQYGNNQGIVNDYLNLATKYKILYLNLLQFQKENMNKREFIRFMKHLLEGHSTMQYGIYFGSRKADNPKHFLQMIKKELKDHKNQKIIYYQEIDKILNKIDNHQGYYNIKDPLLYFNIGWQYGIKEEDSYDYNYFNNNREKFKKYIQSFDNKTLQESEIICHIPLSKEDFNHVFEHMGGSKKKIKRRSRQKKRK
tara:strand:- start:518 stop:1309 length:792 start_codon:yes stop_codon:yes gene_type:complete